MFRRGFERLVSVFKKFLTRSEVGEKVSFADALQRTLGFKPTKISIERVCNTQELLIAKKECLKLSIKSGQFVEGVARTTA